MPAGRHKQMIAKGYFTKLSQCLTWKADLNLGPAGFCQAGPAGHPAFGYEGPVQLFGKPVHCNVCHVHLAVNREGISCLIMGRQLNVADKVKRGRAV